MGDHLVKTVILLATYQGEAWLTPLLDSLSAQTDPDFEVLFQDDGSSDATPSLLRAVSDQDGRFREGKEVGRHLGPAGNFLSLLRQTDGDLIFLCDQDDLWEPDKLSVMKAAMPLRETRPILVHTDLSVVDQDGNLLAPSFFRLEGWDPSAVTLPPLLVQNNATGCAMLLNRPLADRVLAYGTPEKMFMHDWFIALTAAAFGRVLFLDQPLTRYRQHGTNVIGASHSSLIVRGFHALGQRKAAQARIALTYTHTRAFQESYGDTLPAEAAELISAYLATQTMPWFRRVRTVRRLGCVMQSPVTRLGQLFFG